MKHNNRRPGSLLVEFALVVFTLVVLLAAIFDFGRATYSAQVTQQAADQIARQLSQTPLPAEMTGDQVRRAMNGEDAAMGEDTDAFRAVQAVYSKDFLVIDVTGWQGEVTLVEYLDSLPIPVGNRLLIPLMMVETHDSNPLVPEDHRWLRYPGAFVETTGKSASTPYTIRIPTLEPGRPDEQLKPFENWPEVVELARDMSKTGDDQDQFTVQSPARGLVSIRINFPFQAAGPPKAYMPGGLFGPKDEASKFSRLPYAVRPADRPPTVDDLGLGNTNTAGVDSKGVIRFGGEGYVVRPYRRVLSSQGIYRREVFR